jgi:uncharacterized protein YajQ (UPF0234 family)
MKIEADLDSFETEALFDILHHEIIKHSIEAKIQYLCKEINADRLKWHQGHAKFLERIKAKLLAKHYKAAKKHE